MVCARLKEPIIDPLADGARQHTMMTHLHKPAEMSGRERSLLLEATPALAATRLGVWLLPLRTLRRIVARMATMLPDPGAVDRPESVVTAIVRASRCVPGATCSSQVLTVQTLLGRRGQPANVRIGFSGGAGRGLVGHAWVESAGRILIGEGDLAAYAPRPAFVARDEA
jgi:hypothetical protein